MEKKGNKVDFETFHQKHFDLDFGLVVLKYEIFQVTSWKYGDKQKYFRLMIWDCVPLHKALHKILWISVFQIALYSI